MTASPGWTGSSWSHWTPNIGDDRSSRRDRKSVPAPIVTPWNTGERPELGLVPFHGAPTG